MSTIRKALLKYQCLKVVGSSSWTQYTRNWLTLPQLFSRRGLLMIKEMVTPVFMRSSYAMIEKVTFITNNTRNMEDTWICATPSFLKFLSTCLLRAILILKGKHRHKFWRLCTLAIAFRHQINGSTLIQQSCKSLFDRAVMIICEIDNPPRVCYHPRFP